METARRRGTSTSLDPAALPILKRAEKLHQLEDKPNSIITAMPRRIVSTWDLNDSKKLSKYATALATLDILHQSNDKLLQDIHHLSTKRRIREEAGSALSQRCPLSDIHHLSVKRRIRETASSAPSERKPLSDVTNAASFNTPHPHNPLSPQRKGKRRHLFEIHHNLLSLDSSFWKKKLTLLSYPVTKMNRSIPTYVQ